MVKGTISESKERKPTAGTVTVEKNGFHKRIPVRSYAVLLTEVGGSRVKAIRLDAQSSWDEARKTATQDYPGWRFKGIMPLTDRDFQEGEKL